MRRRPARSAGPSCGCDKCHPAGSFISIRLCLMLDRSCGLLSEWDDREEPADAEVTRAGVDVPDVQSTASLATRRFPAISALFGNRVLRHTRGLQGRRLEGSCRAYGMNAVALHRTRIARIYAFPLEETEAIRTELLARYAAGGQLQTV